MSSSSIDFQPRASGDDFETIQSNGTSQAQVKLFGFNILDGCNKKAGRPSTAEAESDGRKYECQYCCREFANSQALGGHQNAHKKERQLLKRAQMQATSRGFSAARLQNPMISPFLQLPHHLLAPALVPAQYLVAHGGRNNTGGGPLHGAQGYYCGPGSRVYGGGGDHAGARDGAGGRTHDGGFRPVSGGDQEVGMKMEKGGGLGLDLHLSLGPAVP